MSQIRQAGALMPTFLRGIANKAGSHEMGKDLVCWR
jgi:hypothetical protein